MKTLKEFDFKNKKALVRCDFNVPLDGKGNILDDYRIKRTVPTLKYLIEKNAKIILMSHLDNPAGKIVESLRLDPIQKRISEYLNLSIIKLQDCVGEKINNEIKNTEGILLLENLRFHPEEENNDPVFAKGLSDLGEIYINEAFSCSHRNHASIVGVPRYLPSAAGLLFENEISVLGNLLKNPQKPLLVIIGGKKVESKAGLINKISEVADCILISGLIDKEIKEKQIKLSRPEKVISPVDDIDTFDIGPKTVELFKNVIRQAKTVFWSGPLGMTEKKEYSKGSEEIADSMIKSETFSVVGGGDTLEFINKLGLAEKFDYVSTGGGAMLVFLSGGKLPGIEALK